jgi:Transposase IS200 like
VALRQEFQKTAAENDNTAANRATQAGVTFHHRCHIVWITKYRYKVLEGAVRERIRTIIWQVCRRPDCLRRFVAGPCPYVRGNTAASCRQRLRAARQGTLIASGADGVSGPAQALLGATFLGSGLLLHHQRQHHGRCHTSVSSGARTYRRQPVVIQSKLQF